MSRAAPLVACLLTLATLAALGDEPKSVPLPISAHNCYPVDGLGGNRLAEAITLGIDNIEIDVGWDDAAHRLIVGHDAAPRPGLTYPAFAEFIRPLLDAPHRPDGAPTVLTIDWKTDRPEAVDQFRSFLDAHADLFSSAPKATNGPLTARRLTVCLTGHPEAKAAYDASIPADGVYRAFADVVHSRGSYRDDPTSYAKEPSTAFHRFLTFDWSVVEAGGPPLARDWTKDEAARLAAIVASSHAKGYRVRFYCLNARGPVLSINYRFPTPDAARVRWKAAADAGADWVASDDYREIASEMRKR